LPALLGPERGLIPCVLIAYKISSRHAQHFKNGNADENDKPQHAHKNHEMSEKPYTELSPVPYE
jgi:hypothetical protein